MPVLVFHTEICREQAPHKEASLIYMMNQHGLNKNMHKESLGEYFANVFWKSGQLLQRETIPKQFFSHLWRTSFILEWNIVKCHQKNTYTTFCWNWSYNLKGVLWSKISVITDDGHPTIQTAHYEYYVLRWLKMNVWPLLMCMHTHSNSWTHAHLLAGTQVLTHTLTNNDDNIKWSALSLRKLPFLSRSKQEGPEGPKALIWDS